MRVRSRAFIRVTATSAVAIVALLFAVGSQNGSGGSDAHADHAAHEVPIPAAAYVPTAPTIARSSESIDSSAHAVTIDLHHVSAVSALHYLPPTQATVTTHFDVALSADAQHWSTVARGTWAPDLSQQTAEFATTGTRYVRFTALDGSTPAASGVSLLGASEVGGPKPTVLLDRSKWTVSASDYEQAPGNVLPPGNVLDGDPYTIWSSSVTGTPAPFPHYITIDMKKIAAISGLTYLPREGGGDGTIGDYSITLSTDGAHYTAPVAQGTWADTTALKYAYFPKQKARYVRLTATSEAGNRGPFTTVAEINVLAPLNPAQAGAWGPVLSFPIIPVSAVLLPHDKLLTFSAYTADAYTTTGAGYTQTSILNLDTGAISQRKVANTGHEMFCSGISLLSDGRVLVAGGSDSGKTSIYDPATNQWSTGPTMNIPRGYQSDVTLSNGKVFTLGGSWSGGEGGKNGEIYTPGGTWRELPKDTATSMLTNDPEGVFRQDNHGWFFASTNGAVFQAGPSKKMHWYSTSGSGRVTFAGSRGTDGDSMNGDAVMYDKNKIFTVGGAAAYSGESADGQPVYANREAYKIDISAGPFHQPTVTRLSNMHYQRAFANGVVLPTGQVVIIGGQSRPIAFVDKAATLQPEMWDPSTNTFTKLASMSVPRDYHSVAVLLPDGRVFSGGGGLCGSCLTNHPDGQIFTPPYLLKADGSLRTRPKISSAPTATHVGATITVHASAGVKSFALIRMGESTHTVDTDQRRIALNPTVHGTTYTLHLPSSTGVLVPGNWMLFAMNSAGTPSISKMIRIPS